MTRLTVQQKRDREFMELLGNALRQQREELTQAFGERLFEENTKAILKGFDLGVIASGAEFAELNVFRRIFWKRPS